MGVVWFTAAALFATLLSAGAVLAASRIWHVSFSLQNLVLVLAPVTQAFLALAAVLRARRVGDGNLAAGLGWLAIQRRADVALLAGFAAVLAMAHVALTISVPAYRDFMGQAKTSIPMPEDVGLGFTAYAAWVFLVIVVGAPLSEELFFRGWLWVGLRHWWNVWITAGVTGMLWLAAHISDGGWRRVLLLVPAMILVSTARALGGSVRASIAVHAANNAVLSAVLIAGKMAGIQ